MQVGSRRLSARLQGKDETQKVTDHGGTTSKAATKESLSSLNSKKRKNDYDEDDDGFAFARVNKNKKPRQLKQDVPTAAVDDSSTATSTTRPIMNGKSSSRSGAPEAVTKPAQNTEPAENPKKRRKKMSFSTPKAKETQPVRRSKRLSSEKVQRDDSPPLEPATTGIKSRKRTKLQPPVAEIKNKEVKEAEVNAESVVQEEPAEPENSTDTNHIGTKISLPFADTPVIRRNKAMREGKTMKGDRRSSLGLRGRRASSLIEAGNSNALPHSEVETTDYYKHIESDIVEPRRMRQLLTWCATRAMHAKPKGTDFQDAVAKSAARVIEEELLKELSNKSELSDWFSREEAPDISKPLPERPNPKNVQNLQKITELEEQINRLKLERDALQTLLKPPEIANLEGSHYARTDIANIERALLSEEDSVLLDAMKATSHLPENVSKRINHISSNMGPSIDQFADRIHILAQYRTATDNMAGTVLSICADKLASREKEERRKALHTEEDRSPGRDLSSVLRGLSKADR